MTLKEQFISEIEREKDSTLKMLERIPADKFDWQPHEKSMTLKKLAIHTAGLLARPGVVIRTEFQDLADGSNKAPEINTTKDLTDYLERGATEALEALKKADDDSFDKKWLLRRGEHVIIEAPKAVVIRSMCLDHMIHHRGQLSVYLRLLNIPVPGMYGPSADDKAKIAGVK